MIHVASIFVGYKVTSISSLNHVGQINGILIDPYKFTVAGFWVDAYNRRYSKNWPILLSQSLRQIDNQRILINDVEDLNPPQDLPRLTEILEIDYQIVSKKVVSTDGQYLGRAEDFSFNDDNFKITYIVVKPPFYQRVTKNRLQFVRKQIEKVSSHEIEVRITPQTQSLQSLPTNSLY